MVQGSKISNSVVLAETCSSLVPRENTGVQLAPQNPPISRTRGWPFVPPALLLWTFYCMNFVQRESESVSCSVMSTLLLPMDRSPPGSSVPGILQARVLEWVTMPSFRGIFPAQGSNPSLLPCRRILYQLRYQGSPFARLGCYKTVYY